MLKKAKSKNKLEEIKEEYNDETLNKLINGMLKKNASGLENKDREKVVLMIASFVDEPEAKESASSDG